jgi:two-component system, cell cycle response regulator DivK
MSHILVVEDDAHNAILFRKVLEKRGGHEVTVCEDGDQVMAMARAGGIALIVMDVSLANTHVDGKRANGVDLCRRLKNDPLTVAIPVILATAHAMRGDAETLLAESGADEYVSKPIIDHAGFVSLVARTLAEAA